MSAPKVMAVIAGSSEVLLLCNHEKIRDCTASPKTGFNSGAKGEGPLGACHE
jgi:hypothetical protein